MDVEFNKDNACMCSADCKFASACAATHDSTKCELWNKPNEHLHHDAKHRPLRHPKCMRNDPTFNHLQPPPPKGKPCESVWRGDKRSGKYTKQIGDVELELMRDHLGPNRDQDKFTWMADWKRTDGTHGQDHGRVQQTLLAAKRQATARAKRSIKERRAGSSTG